MKKLFDNIYDISVTLGNESINFPGDISFSSPLMSLFESIADCLMAVLDASSILDYYLQMIYAVNVA